MRLWILFTVLLIGIVIVESGRSSSSKRKKDRQRSETISDSSQQEDSASESRRKKDEDDKREHADREHERDHREGEKKGKDSSSSEEDDKDDKAEKNETTVAKGGKTLLRLRRTQTSDKVEVKIDEHTRARRRKHNQLHRMRDVHRGRRQLVRAQELNDGEQQALSEKQKVAVDRHFKETPSYPPIDESGRRRPSRMIAFRPKYLVRRERKVSTFLPDVDLDISKFL
ncbi:unnamed protein product [Anisakis simplex]|uniref:Uncharacterized protein n=1 Tax=Anisakis simplex TaxID=6269 RepID=A0A0M3JSG5_ANISI|nr:unnamed protein product [Anisakis simplex]